MTREIVSDLETFIGSQEHVETNDGYFGPDVDLFDYGYLDSFGIVALIEHVLKTHGVDLSTADFYEGQLRTVSGIARYIATEKSKSGERDSESPASASL